MALLGNYTIFHKSPGKWLGGSASGQGMNLGDSSTASTRRGRFVGWASLDAKNSTPVGYAPGTAAFVIAIKGGGMAVTDSLHIVGDGNITNFNLAGGLNAEAPLSGSGSITDAAAQLVVSAVATIAGAANFTGDIEAPLEAIATLAGTGDISAAAGEALAWIQSNLTGVGTVSTATSSGPANMSADVLPYTELSPQALADAVWNADMAPGEVPTYANPGTAGFIMTMLHWMQNGKMITDPVTGQMTVYNDADQVIGTFNIYEDADGTVPYAGGGVEYRSSRF